MLQPATEKYTMVIFKKKFWATVLSVVLTFFVECVYAIIFLMLYLTIYSITEYEPLNTGTPVLIAKGLLILPPLIYNTKKIIAAYKVRDFVSVFGFIGITISYSIGIIYLGGGGR